MKKWMGWIAMIFLLTGCGKPEVYETLNDGYIQQVKPPAQIICVSMPDSAMMPTLDTGMTDRLYFCDGYTVMTQIIDSGDIEKTFQDVTGFPRDKLSPIQTKEGEFTRYDCVWTSAGETGDEIGRAAILDDGEYHYILTAMADASIHQAISEEWNSLFQSFSITDELQINTGS